MRKKPDNNTSLLLSVPHAIPCCSGLLAGVPAAPAHAFHGEHLPPAAELLRGAVRGEGSGHGNTHPQGERACERELVVHSGVVDPMTP